jgi:SAM-dependent methyltransferase
MAEDLEVAVARHYGTSDLTDRILKAMAAAGIDATSVAPEQLAPVDEFHIGGRAATIHGVSKMGLTTADHVLDVGCGIGGATRYLASTVGCRVTGIDLTPAYIAAAEDLASRTGLADRVTYRVASALAMPFEDGTFDAAITLHVAMNIADRGGLYREVARVLKPGAVFCIYDVMKGHSAGLKFPVPWAESPATRRCSAMPGSRWGRSRTGRRSPSTSFARALPPPARQRSASTSCWAPPPARNSRTCWPISKVARLYRP